MSREIRIQFTLDPAREERIQHFGTDAVNKAIETGGRVVSIQGPNMLTKKCDGAGDGMQRFAFVGVSLNVTVEDPS